MRRDPDYWRVALETVAAGAGVLLALACCRMAIALVSWWAR